MSTYRVDARGALNVGGPLERTGSVSALAPAPQGAMLLTAGHVALPCASAATPTVIVRRYSRQDPGGAHPSALTFEPAVSAVLMEGHLDEGRLDGSGDWAIAVLAGALAIESHPVSGLRPPLPTRAAPLTPGDTVFQWSRTRKRIVGADVASPVLGNVTLTLPDGRANPYEGLVRVRPLGDDFSAPGDSGSLVVDARRKVVGVLIGLSTDHLIAFVMPIARLRGQLPDFYAFFAEPT